ncbi:MAG: hypothetical protein F6K30_12970 [Cyanothece sp. SIO2G6]|nr:hypothetical protein [Cyanothece sp. SIO2G6]
MVSTSSLPVPLRSGSPYSLSLSNRFQGAIAGAVLGYLIAVSYSDPDQRCPLTQTLDLRWLSDLVGTKNSMAQGDKRLLFYPQLHSATQPEPQQSTQGFLNSETDLETDFETDFETNLETDLSIDLSLVPLLDAMVGVLDHCCNYGYASPDLDSSILGPTPQSAIQATLVLLPLLLLHHENQTRQKQAIASTLTQWSASKSWASEINILGTILATALSPNPGIRQRSSLAVATSRPLQSKPEDDITQLEHPVTSEAKVIISCFLHQPHSYEIGLMTLLTHHFPNQIPNQSNQTDGERSAMAAILGALLGGYGGFSGLPLLWQYALEQSMPVARTTATTPVVTDASHNHSQSAASGSPAKSLASKKLVFWSIQLMEVWSGISKINSGGENSSFSVSTPPTVTSPRALGLDR